MDTNIPELIRTEKYSDLAKCLSEYMGVEIEPTMLKRACVLTPEIGFDNRAEWSHATWLTWLRTRLMDSGVFRIDGRSREEAEDLIMFTEAAMIRRQQVSFGTGGTRQGRSLNSVDDDPDAYRLSSDPDR
jgi:hypothetical protein